MAAICRLHKLALQVGPGDSEPFVISVPVGTGHISFMEAIKYELRYCWKVLGSCNQSYRCINCSTGSPGWDSFCQALFGWWERSKQPFGCERVGSREVMPENLRQALPLELYITKSKIPKFKSLTEGQCWSWCGPSNMRAKLCPEYIYKGKKFNVFFPISSTFAALWWSPSA